MWDEPYMHSDGRTIEIGDLFQDSPGRTVVRTLRVSTITPWTGIGSLLQHDIGLGVLDEAGRVTRVVTMNANRLLSKAFVRVEEV